MTTRIVVAGATGNLGTRVTKALIGRGAQTVALARTGTSPEKIEVLQGFGAEVVVVNLASAGEVAAALDGAACLVSVVQGLHDVIVDTQAVLLDAALKAGVPRFIPSDFSTDFTVLPAGENRNFDLRRAFHERLDTADLASTSIFNAAFGEILTYNVPLLNFGQRQVGYWGDADHRLDFTTMDDTAAYTAAAALDTTTPRALRIASFQVSPSDLARFTAETLHISFALKRLGSLDDLRQHNQRERAAHPEGEDEVYPDWQQGQYIQSMFSTQHASLDNDRYPDVRWTALQDLIQPRS